MISETKLLLSPSPAFHFEYLIGPCLNCVDRLNGPNMWDVPRCSVNDARDHKGSLDT